MSDLVDGKTMQGRVDERLKLAAHFDAMMAELQHGRHQLMISRIGEVSYDMQDLRLSYTRTKGRVIELLQDSLI